jgi:OOP family OmpA-OmpF porin
MKKITMSIITATSLLIAGDYQYEITPMIGYVQTKEHVDFKNHKVGGVAFSINKGDDCKFDQIEIGLLHSNGADYESNSGSSKINQLFVNGVKEYKIDDKFNLYALAGLGYEYIDNNLNHNDSDPFFNYGIGVKYKIVDNIALKFDVRHLLKFDGDKNLLYTAGLSIPFGKVTKKVIKQSEPKITIWPVKDSDNDGVINLKDNCPNTKAGAKVGHSGCEIILDIDKDFDNDGVMDSVDKCLTTPYGEKVDATGCTVLMKPVDLGIIFDIDSAKIDKNDESKFIKYVNYLNKVQDANIVIEGHTDSSASTKYNQLLSEKRANSVKNKLIQMSIESKRIKAIGYGELKPLVPNDTKRNKQINRRVTARIVK